MSLGLLQVSDAERFGAHQRCEGAGEEGTGAARLAGGLELPLSFLEPPAVDIRVRLPKLKQHPKLKLLPACRRNSRKMMASYQNDLFNHKILTEQYMV